MEPKLKRVTVKKCASRREANSELAKGLLRITGPASLSFLVTALASEPYNLTTEEIIRALNDINGRGLLRILRFSDDWMVNSDVGLVLSLV